MSGLVHIYTGEGKGKTTAAVGLGIRACGRGKKVLLVQFLKGSETGEMFIIEKLKPDFELYRHKEIGKFSWNMTQDELHAMKNDIEHLFQYAVSEALNRKRDMVILDEIMASITTGFIELEDVMDFVKNKPVGLELVLTGRNAPRELMELADYVSEIKAVKHPLMMGISAREGVEF